MEITQEQIAEHIKFLVQFGDVYTTDGNNYILDSSGERVQIKARKKDEAKPIQVFHPNMKGEKGKFILNPFTEALTTLAELKWFWESRSSILSFLVSRTAHKVCELCVNPPEDSSVELDEVLSNFTDTVDQKMVDHLSQFQSSDWLSMIYHKKSKTAYLQSNVMDPEWRKKWGNKMRKKDWRFVDAFMEMLGLNDVEPFQFRSNTIGLIECEARLNVLAMFAETVNPYLHAVLGVDLQPAEFQVILNNLDEYNKASLWFSSASSSRDQQQSANQGNRVPWEQNQGSVPSSQALPNNAAPPQYGNVGPASNAQLPGPQAGMQQGGGVQQQQVASPPQQNFDAVPMSQTSGMGSPAFATGGNPMGGGFHNAAMMNNPGGMMGGGMQNMGNYQGLPMGGGYGTQAPQASTLPTNIGFPS